MCDNCRMDSIVDSHFHIWDLALRRSYPYTDASFDWPGPQPATAAIHRDFTAAEVAAELGGSKVNNDNNCYNDNNSDDNNNDQVEAAIFVQCLNRCPEEVAWVSKLAEEHPVIKGIVAGLDLTQVRQPGGSSSVTTPRARTPRRCGPRCGPRRGWWGCGTSWTWRRRTGSCGRRWPGGCRC